MHHFLHLIVTSLQGCNGCILADSRCTHDGILMDFQHLLAKRLWRSQKSQTPTCHGKRLGKAIDQNGTLLHTLQLCNGAMLSAIRLLAVNLIGKYHNIGLPQNVCNLFQIFPRHNAASRIIRKRKNQHFGLFRNVLPQFLCG